jgi:hypothetical protein
MSFENNTQDLEGVDLEPKDQRKAWRIVGAVLLTILLPVIVVALWRIVLRS